MPFGSTRGVVLTSRSRGKSSAKTILTLARFNGIVGWIVKDVLGITPEFITATEARAAVGVGRRDKSVNIKEHILNFRWLNEIELELIDGGHPVYRYMVAIEQ